MRNIEYKYATKLQTQSRVLTIKESYFDSYMQTLPIYIPTFMAAANQILTIHQSILCQGPKALAGQECFTDTGARANRALPCSFLWGSERLNILEMTLWYLRRQRLSMTCNDKKLITSADLWHNLKGMNPG
ncbi:hypothetical protein L1049_024260 [Liquidambar formosana]|uniref:Uncharacterized protein n=1 Tax=Liquidambar formosana TaxID=63359 RepID=A0AAP0RUK9_LIQFO